MAYKHFLRLRRTVRLGGWKLGPLRFRGGKYTVGPISVLRALDLAAVIPTLLKVGPQGEPDFEKLVGDLPADGITALLPLFVQEPIRRRHLKRTTPIQAITSFLTMMRVNDWPYIFNALKPKPQEKGVGIEVLIHSIVRQCPAYTHRDVLLLPMQEVLAISDAAKQLDGVAETAVPLDAEDRDLLRRAGFRVN